MTPEDWEEVRRGYTELKAAYESSRGMLDMSYMSGVAAFGLYTALLDLHERVQVLEKALRHKDITG